MAPSPYQLLHDDDHDETVELRICDQAPDDSDHEQPRQWLHLDQLLHDDDHDETIEFGICDQAPDDRDHEQPR